MKTIICLLIPLVCGLLLIGPGLIEKATLPRWEVIVIDEYGWVNVYLSDDTTGYRTSKNHIQIKENKP